MRALRNPEPDNLLIGRIGAPLSWCRWPEAKALLTPALATSDEEWPSVEADLQTGDCQLWAVFDGNLMLAAAVTRIAQTKRGEVVEIYLVGGTDYARWIAPLNDEIEDEARQIGCTAIRAFGRKGWTNILSDLGWKPGAIAYEKAL